MSYQEPPRDLGEAFAQVSRELGNALTDFGFVARGQGAMGWLLQGERERARDTLAALTPDQRAQVAAAARQLAILAGES